MPAAPDADRARVRAVAREIGDRLRDARRRSRRASSASCVRRCDDDRPVGVDDRGAQVRATEVDAERRPRRGNLRSRGSLGLVALRCASTRSAASMTARAASSSASAAATSESRTSGTVPSTSAMRVSSADGGGSTRSSLPTVVVVDRLGMRPVVGRRHAVTVLPPLA